MACQSPQVGESLHKLLLRDWTKPYVIGAGDGKYTRANVLLHTLLLELRHDKAMVAATNLQEGDGEAVDVHLRVVRLACFEQTNASR